MSSQGNHATGGPRAAILGWPVEHSRSPIIHRHWLETYGLEGSYDRIAVLPEEAERFFRDFGSSGLVGANVTIPHKETAFACCDELDETARALGAVNTLVWNDGRLVGSNTDGFGFLGSLDAAAPGWDANAGKAVVLGAGGAARAVVWALLSRGFDVDLLNRTRERAEVLAEQFSERVRVRDFENIAAALKDAAVLANTTSLGMQGNPPLEINLSSLPTSAIVTDIVYIPLETPLLRLARERGLRTVDGLGMLLHQAVPGFELWFGRRPRVTPELRRIVLADMGTEEHST